MNTLISFYPHIRYLGEDLTETNLYVDKRMRVVEEGLTDIVLYIFKPTFAPEGFSTGAHGNNFIKSINGELSAGVWAFIADSNSLFISYKGKYELYDLVFLNSIFLIYKKHRNQHTPIVGRKYILLVQERYGRKSWKQLMAMLYDAHRKNMGTMALIIMAVVAVFFFIIFLYL